MSAAALIRQNVLIEMKEERIAGNFDRGPQGRVAETDRALTVYN